MSRDVTEDLSEFYVPVHKSLIRREDALGGIPMSAWLLIGGTFLFFVLMLEMWYMTPLSMLLHFVAKRMSKADPFLWDIVLTSISVPDVLEG
jgi:type IV secretory pathway TrbD component